jgi:ABC-type molybdenum transport system ATPase subunit/photorepair protein PhrA
VRELSFGQVRLVDLARATVHRPRVLLLDEPASGLDDEARELLAEGALDTGADTVLVAAHGEPVVRTTRRLELSAGRVRGPSA